eukprot:1141501-Pelagomonas_calceolata.AAC.2
MHSKVFFLSLCKVLWEGGCQGTPPDVWMHTRVTHCGAGLASLYRQKRCRDWAGSTAAGGSWSLQRQGQGQGGWQGRENFTWKFDWAVPCSTCQSDPPTATFELTWGWERKRHLGIFKPRGRKLRGLRFVVFCCAAVCILVGVSGTFYAPHTLDCFPTHASLSTLAIRGIAIKAAVNNGHFSGNAKP